MKNSDGSESDLNEEQRYLMGASLSAYLQSLIRDGNLKADSEDLLMKTFDVVGLGQCALDFLCIVPRHPGVDTKCETSHLTMQGGGPVATAMVTARRLGLKAAFLGKVGDDFAGREIIRGLKKEGVDTEGLSVARGKTSQTAFIAIEEKTARRTIFWTKGSSFPLNPEEIHWKTLENAAFLHLDGLHIDASIEAARFARNNSIPTMLDAGTFREEVLPLLPLIDYIVVAESFALKYCGDIEKALYRLADNGARLLCITMGARGCVALSENHILRQDAFAIEAIDTTGCGDAFHGGLIYAIIKKLPLKKALEFASAVAALKCREIGGRAALPSPEAVEAFLGKSGTKPEM